MEADREFTNDRVYRNKEITVYWKPDACIHATYCYRELLEVFDPSRRPWVDMDGASTERIIEVVNLCPTEALTWKWNDEEKNNAVKPEHTNHIKFRRPELIEAMDEQKKEEEPVVIRVMNDGPVIIKGYYVLKYDDITREVDDNYTSLCRCGKSRNQPFCDGSHSIKSDH